jgi:hypothetical protein
MCPRELQKQRTKSVPATTPRCAVCGEQAGEKVTRCDQCHKEVCMTCSSIEAVVGNRQGRRLCLKCQDTMLECYECGRHAGIDEMEECPVCGEYYCEACIDGHACSG